METSFKMIANEILLKNHQNFLNIAKETFDKVLHVEKAELDKKENNFFNLINPIKSALENFENKITQIEKDRVNSYSDLRRQVQDMMVFQQELQKETSALNKALSSPNMTGQWGEMQLRRVVEIAGMVSHCDFFEQQQEENSRRRPDMVIRLPNKRNIVVDAKTPVNAYMQAVNTGDKEYYKSHTEAIKKHIRMLSQKAYWEQFSPTPEFVIMFLPGESFFSSAMKIDPTLIEFGAHEKVIIATPITLIALLKTIAFTWQQEAITQNAKKIGEVGKNVYKYLEELIGYTKDFERRLQKNNDEFSKISSLIEKRIAPATLKLKTLGIEIKPELPDQPEGE
ncbi:MAG: DNA recombination protein RmuC [Alphaproteobacteria bacterium]|nr:DNA recombination protein RmuC [Alphaproteobacteria bacterium]